ncbi:MAG: 30S ribosomal protein S15 [Gammaproteobacteria bacterium]|nr:MAG: 30S ribosomal protein S15 [Gammaproteobacteria bacterium]
MSLTTAAKAEIIKTYQRSEGDTGSSEVQIALLTGQINNITEHLKSHKKDVHSRHGLMNMVSQRRKLMRYLKGQNLQRYQSIIKELDIRG